MGVRVFDVEALRDLLTEAGFTEVEFQRWGATLFYGARG